MIDFDVFAILFNASLTLCILSFLYKESHAYRFGEHLFLGSFAGQTLLFAINNINNTCVTKITRGSLIYLVPFILGILLYAGIFAAPTSIRWLNRYPLAFLVAVFLGVNFRAQTNTYIFTALRQSFLDLTDFSNLVLVVALLTTAFYFLFSFKRVFHPTVDKYVRDIGQIFIMIYFGVEYGTTTMGRLSQMISRVDYLLQWPAVIMVPIAIAVGIIAYYTTRKRP